MDKLVAGNWKMNGGLASNRLLLDAFTPVSGVDMLVCVPYPYLSQAQQRTPSIALGAQDVSEFPAGAYTGEVSAAMLRDFDCTFVIVGHSERRALFHEDNATVARKAAAALAAGVTPIVCVGETLAERDAGRVMDVIGAQLSAVLEVLGVAAMARIVLAYEPVWAIGAGRSASAEQVAGVHGAIRAWLATRGVDAGTLRILYGGSVKPQNAAELFAIQHVDGALVGGASLVADDFMAICRAAAHR
ncbi:triose-phosphate isomerase [Thauera sp. 2A1]|uniref:triose-phosphate isomerase n=1 Tax=Thauera sp. 2A1 TaxID=2570191 RepID=UPI0012918C66|nr:triose-phosphate isomerase [Thauera sp. 2A1]KAI5914933.1 triose-phosphate isomerase [Thauera sp. 2A1]